MRADFESFDLIIEGESHSESMSVKMSGLPRGYRVDTEELRSFTARRRAGVNVWSTPRKEADEARIDSGITYGMTDGSDLCARIINTNIKPHDYGNLITCPRPSHADYVMYVKDGRIASGGGRFSGRLTAPLCIAGGIAKQILSAKGISIHAYVAEIGGVKCGSYKDTKITKDLLDSVKNDELSIICAEKRAEIVDVIAQASKDGDSVGGRIECVVFGLSAGEIGDSLFEGLEGKIAYSVFGVPAVKGVEFGAGFELASMRGSEANDAFVMREGRVETDTNNSGGINGGISNGMPVTLAAAIRPTPSISKRQKSVDLASGTECEIEVGGRHDACIVPRAVPVIESAVALAVLDEMMKANKI